MLKMIKKILKRIEVYDIENNATLIFDNRADADRYIKMQVALEHNDPLGMDIETDFKEIKFKRIQNII